MYSYMYEVYMDIDWQQEYFSSNCGLLSYKELNIVGIGLSLKYQYLGTKGRNVKTIEIAI